MRPTRPALRLLALALLMAGTVRPASAGSDSPVPVQDPQGLVLPLPGCGIAGRVVTLPRAQQVRLVLPAHRRARQQARRSGKAARPPAAADLGALAWQALYGCAVSTPEEAGVTTGARPLRPT
jgi:hypothetical protein